MSNVGNLLLSLGLKVKGESGHEVNFYCPSCDNGNGDAHGYANSETGAWDCKKGCGKGRHPYSLVAFIRYGRKPTELSKEQKAEVKGVLREHGLADDGQQNGAASRPTLTIADLARQKGITAASL